MTVYLFQRKEFRKKALERERERERVRARERESERERERERACVRARARAYEENTYFLSDTLSCEP